MHTLWQDVRHSLRLLRLNPGFTTVAILSLALGIGANTAIFQLLDAVRLRTLPAKDPQQLAIVRLETHNWSAGRHHGRYSDITNPQWEQIRDHQEGFSSIFAWAENDFNLASSGEARYAHGMFVSGDFFKVLETQPLIGRLLSTEDDRRGCGAQAAVVSYAFWQHEYNGDPGVIGHKITLDGNPFPIVGVTPPGFFGVEIGRRFDVAIPICSEPIINKEDGMLNMRHGYWLAAMGRLKPGWTVERATAQLNTVSPAILEATVPEAYKAEDVKKYMAYKFYAVPASNGFSQLRQEYENPLWILLAIAALVLLIACANLANLMLARASSREREVAVRLAMGASRSALLRQMFVESLLLAAMGAVSGAALASLLSRFLVAFISTQGSPLFMDCARIGAFSFHRSVRCFHVRAFRSDSGSARHASRARAGTENCIPRHDCRARTLWLAPDARRFAGGVLAGAPRRLSFSFALCAICSRSIPASARRTRSSRLSI